MEFNIDVKPLMKLKFGQMSFVFDADNIQYLELMNLHEQWAKLTRANCHTLHSAATFHPNQYMAIYYILFSANTFFSDLCLQAQNTCNEARQYHHHYKMSSLQDINMIQYHHH